jgi:hypothetical protein
MHVRIQDFVITRSCRSDESFPIVVTFTTQDHLQIKIRLARSQTAELIGRLAKWLED